MDDAKLNRLREELKNARKKRDSLDAKVKDLERRYKEAENTCIHDIVHAANLTPEQLARLISAVTNGLPQGSFDDKGDDDTNKAEALEEAIEE